MLTLLNVNIKNVYCACPFRWKMHSRYLSQSNYIMSVLHKYYIIFKFNIYDILVTSIPYYVQIAKQNMSVGFLNLIHISIQIYICFFIFIYKYDIYMVCMSNKLITCSSVKSWSINYLQLGITVFKILPAVLCRYKRRQSLRPITYHDAVHKMGTNRPTLLCRPSPTLVLGLHLHKRAWTTYNIYI